MRWWLTLCLVLPAACDKLADNRPANDSASHGSDLGMHEEAVKISTTEPSVGTLTVGDQNLAQRFPLPVMPSAEIEHIARLEPPGKPEILQMSLRSPAALSRVGNYYESAMRAKGMKVQSSQSAKDPNQLFLMGESASASATVLLTHQLDTDSTSVSLSWTGKSPGASGPASASIDQKKPVDSIPDSPRKSP